MALSRPAADDFALVGDEAACGSAGRGLGPFDIDRSRRRQSRKYQPADAVAAGTDESRAARSCDVRAASQTMRRRLTRTTWRRTRQHVGRRAADASPQAVAEPADGSGWYAANAAERPARFTTVEEEEARRRGAASAVVAARWPGSWRCSPPCWRAWRRRLLLVAAADRPTSCIEPSRRGRMSTSRTSLLNVSNEKSMSFSSGIRTIRTRLRFGGYQERIELDKLERKLQRQPRQRQRRSDSAACRATVSAGHERGQGIAGDSGGDAASRWSICIEPDATVGGDKDADERELRQSFNWRGGGWTTLRDGNRQARRSGSGRRLQSGWKRRAKLAI